MIKKKKKKKAIKKKSTRGTQWEGANFILQEGEKFQPKNMPPSKPEKRNPRFKMREEDRRPRRPGEKRYYA